MGETVVAPEWRGASLGPIGAGPQSHAGHAAGFATKPMAGDELRRLHERFVTDPANTDLSALRPVIARSWLRSQACNVSPGMRVLDTMCEPQLDEPVLRCAEPVLRDLERTCLDTGGCVSVTDARGTMALFRGAPSVVRWAEGIFPLCGSSMLEEASGTNSEGTAIEEGFGVQVWGAEHYAEVLQDSCCTSVPIRDPLRQSVRGVLSVTLPERVALQSDPRSIGLIVHAAAAEVTRSLGDHLAAREQALLSAYLREVRKRGTDAVIAMDDRTTIASRAAAQMLDASDHAVLSGYAREAERLRRPVERDVTIAPGRTLRLRIRPVEAGKDIAGSILCLRSVAATPSDARTGHGAHRTDPFSSLVGDSLALRRALDVANAAVARRVPAYILGERGSGKLHLADEMARRLCVSVLSLDCEGSDLASVDDLSRMEQHLLGGGAAVLQHAEALRDELREPLIAMISAFEHPRLVLTACRLSNDMMSLTAALRGAEIQMPPLSARRDDIPLLARHIVQSVHHGPRDVSPRLLQALTEADWPGNVRQLQEVMTSAAARTTGGSVQVHDLTQAHRKAMARQPLSRLEEAELQKIREALVEAGGNRVKAAAILQIGRSTLYRKIDMYARRGFIDGSV